MALQEFHFNPAELESRRRLARAFQGLCLLAALLGLAAFWGLEARSPGWLSLVALGGAGLAWRGPRRWLASLQGSVLRVQPNAVELSRGNFTRFVLLEEVESIRVKRRQDDSITGIILETHEGPLAIRGFNDMEMIFGHISARKDEGALIQLEPAGPFLLRPATWLGLAAAAAAAGLALWSLVA